MREAPLPKAWWAGIAAIAAVSTAIYLTIAPTKAPAQKAPAAPPTHQWFVPVIAGMMDCVDTTRIRPKDSQSPAVAAESLQAAGYHAQIVERGGGLVVVVVEGLGDTGSYYRTLEDCRAATGFHPVQNTTGAALDKYR